MAEQAPAHRSTPNTQAPLQSKDVYVQGRAISDASGNGQQPGNSSISPYLKSCKDLVEDVGTICPRLQQMAGHDKGQSDEEASIIMHGFGDAWNNYRARILTAWSHIEDENPIHDPMCTIASHGPIESGHSEICQFRTQLGRMIDRPVDAFRHILFANRLPKEHTHEKLLEEQYFVKNWIHILNWILLKNDTKIKNIRERYPGVVQYAAQWMQSAHVLHILWTQAHAVKLNFSAELQQRCVYEEACCAVQQHRQAESGKAQTHEIESGPEDMETEETDSNQSRGVVETKLYAIAAAEQGTQSEAQDIAPTDRFPSTTKKSTQTTENWAKDDTVPSARFAKLQEDRDSLQKQVDHYCQANQELTQKQIHLQEENQKYKDETELLRTEYTKLSDKNEHLTTSNNKWEQKYEGIRVDYTKQLNTAHQRARQTVEQKDVEIRRLQHEHERLVGQNRSLKEEKDGLLNSMSSLMNQQMSRDESDLENINVKNRPMKILDDYGLFVSQEWLDAKTAIDEWMEERHYDADDSEICAQITSSMMECYEFAAKLYANTTGHFADVLHNPLRSCVVERFTPSHTDEEGLDVDYTTVQHKPPQADAALDTDFQLSISKSLRTSSDAVDFKEFAKKLTAQLCEHLMDIPTDDALLNNKDLLEFCERCLAMCWKMALQQPPMRFECLPEPGGPYDENKHELHFGSADPSKPNVVVHYYVHPAMCHGDRQMKKARVVLHAKPEEQPPSPAAQDEGIPTGGATDKPSTAAQDEGMPTGGATDLPTEPREDSDSEAESWSRLTEDGGSARVMAPAPCDMADSRGEPTLESTQHEMQYPADPAAPTDMDDVD